MVNILVKTQINIVRTTFLIYVFLTCSSFFQQTFAEVYICKGKYSKRYHYDKSCRGLSNCSTNIYKVDLNEAKRLGRTLCGWED